MKNIIGLAVLGSVMASPAWANQSLSVAYPPATYKTASDRISLIGTAPPGGEVLVNGKAIQRSPAGHFAPRFPLKVGDNLFNLRYKNKEVKIKVTRTAAQSQPPKGLEFKKDSLTPGTDIARLPGELICFGAVAPPNANVSVQLGGETIPLRNQDILFDLPANNAALTENNQPIAIAGAGQYLGCAAAAAAADLGFPQFQLSMTPPPGASVLPPPSASALPSPLPVVRHVSKIAGEGAEGSGSIITQQGPGKVQILSPANLEVAEVISEAGVARTGPSTDYSRLTPLPKGTRASITGIEGEWLRLDYGGWIKGDEVRRVKGSAPPKSIIRSITTRQLPGKTEVIFPLQVQVPMVVQQGDRTLTLTLYNTTAQTDIIRLNPDPLITRLDWQQTAPGMVQYTFNLKPQQQWGYKLRYEGTSLVLTLRHPPLEGKTPLIKTNRSLAGIKILLDPGHGGKETGAPGPNGYPEKDVNLIVSKLIAERLIQRGAIVYLTRETDKELSLPDRVAMIDKIEPAIALSIHYNSLPDDGDMMNTQGVGMFWYHPQAHNLAVFMHNHIVKDLGRPSYGVFWDNLALARPASAPSVLMELGFMSNPNEFEWVVNPYEQQRLADAIAEGIEQWFISVK